jgi:hypothetical protein
MSRNFRHSLQSSDYRNSLQSTITTETEPSSPSPSNATPFPSLKNLPPLLDLLSRPPYYLFVELRSYAYVDRQIIVQASHPPSLSLLATYLETQCRSMTVKWEPSAYGPAPMQDRVVLTPNRSTAKTTSEISAAPLLALIESVLGYDLASSDFTEGSYRWRYKRTAPYTDQPVMRMDAYPL